MRLLNGLFRRASALAAARRAFPPAALDAIAKLIAQGEATHDAEIKLIIETTPCRAALHRRSHHQGGSGQGSAARARANELFAEYRIWDTENNSGVLVYLNLADRKVEIVADRGVNRVLATADWHAVCRRITDGFKSGEFDAGVLAALRHLNERLANQYPPRPPSHDQISPAPVVL
jgi:uncharacterized membrane protein